MKCSKCGIELGEPTAHAMTAVHYMTDDSGVMCSSCAGKWVASLTEPREPCCELWKRATEFGSYAPTVPGSDGEMFKLNQSRWLPPIHYCPWCGARKGNDERT